MSCVLMYGMFGEDRVVSMSMLQGFCDGGQNDKVDVISEDL